MHSSTNALRWYVLTLLIGVITVTSMGRFAIAPLGPVLIEQLGISNGLLGVLSAALGLSAVLFTVGAGILLDRRGVKWTILLSLATMAVFLLLFFAAHGFGLILVLFFLVGVGFSGIGPATTAGIPLWFDRSRRGLAMGLKQAGIPLGTALVAISLPPIINSVGWRLSLVSIGGVTLMAGIAFYLLFPNGGNGTSDSRSAMQGSAEAQPDTVSSNFMWDLWWLSLIGLALSFVQSALTIFLIPFLESYLLLGLVAAGGYFSLTQVAGLVARPLSGLLSDRVTSGRRKPLLIAMALLAGLTVALLPHVGPSALAPLLVLLGLSAFGWPALFFLLTVEQAPVARMGFASGVTQTMFKIGSLAGPPVVGFIIDAYSFRAAMHAMSVGLVVSTLVFMFVFSESRRR